MTTFRDALAAALDATMKQMGRPIEWPEDADAIIAALPPDMRLAIEDGLALARLVDTLPADRGLSWHGDEVGWHLRLDREDDGAWYVQAWPPTADYEPMLDDMRTGHAPTIAAACDAAREALEPDDG